MKEYIVKFTGGQTNRVIASDPHNAVAIAIWSLCVAQAPPFNADPTINPVTSVEIDNGQTSFGVPIS